MIGGIFYLFAVPLISLFFGIAITMNWDEHNPPHFHVKYAEHEAIILIAEGIVAKGFLPAKQLKLVLAWAEIHKDELMQNWELSKIKEPINKIAPLM